MYTKVNIDYIYLILVQLSLILFYRFFFNFWNKIFNWVSLVIVIFKNIQYLTTFLIILLSKHTHTYIFINSPQLNYFYFTYSLKVTFIKKCKPIKSYIHLDLLYPIFFVLYWGKRYIMKIHKQLITTGGKKIIYIYL